MKEIQKLFTAVAVIISCQQTLAQSIERQAIGSTGILTNTGTIQGSSTVGESVINTHSQATLIITQGFQQPDSNTTVGIRSIENSSINIIAYPNPTTDEVIIQFSSGFSSRVSITLYNENGKLIGQQVLKSFVENYKHHQSFTGYAAGNYFIDIKSDDSSIKKVFRIQKIN